MKVLLVEPDILSASVIERYVAGENTTVMHASTAQKAVQLADRDTPDLVILELLIADQNGIAFLYELRSHFDWMGIPIIIHTHIPSDELSMKPETWIPLGVIEYLYKPTTSLKKIKNRIQMVLN